MKISFFANIRYIIIINSCKKNSPGRYFSIGLIKMENMIFHGDNTRMILRMNIESGLLRFSFNRHKQIVWYDFILRCSKNIQPYKISQRQLMRNFSHTTNDSGTTLVLAISSKQQKSSQMNTMEYFQRINQFSKNSLVLESIPPEQYLHSDILILFSPGIPILKPYFRDTINEINKSNSLNQKKRKLKKIFENLLQIKIS